MGVVRVVLQDKGINNYCISKLYYMLEGEEYHGQKEKLSWVWKAGVLYGKLYGQFLEMSE